MAVNKFTIIAYQTGSDSFHLKVNADCATGFLKEVMSQWINSEPKILDVLIDVTLDKMLERIVERESPDTDTQAEQCAEKLKNMIFKKGL